MSDEILTREPWPALGIESYKSIDNGEWGYLIHYRSGKFVFDESVKPSREEIMRRWSYRLGSSNASN